MLNKQDLKKPVNKRIKIHCKNHFELALRIGSRYSEIVVKDEHRSYAEPLLAQRFLLFQGLLLGLVAPPSFSECKFFDRLQGNPAFGVLYAPAIRVRTAETVS